jgi:chromosome transmission fidelity protein 18
MSLVSSPVVYHSSSSPTFSDHANRKRPNDEEEQAPFKKRLFGRNLFQSEKQKLPLGDGQAVPVKEPGFTEQENRDPGGISQVAVLAAAAVAAEEVEGAPAPLAGHVAPLNLLIHSDLPESVVTSFSDIAKPLFVPRTTRGKKHFIRRKDAYIAPSYERLIAERSTTQPGRAKTAYYGIDIHNLIDEAKATSKTRESEAQIPPPQIQHASSIETSCKKSKRDAMMWTEKYRAKKFADLVGDERTHRIVMKWLKGWDTIVFPGITRPKLTGKLKEEWGEEKVHRKILLLAGPPGLGKTTLAHVCAKQAGYETVEINASDERSRDVVKGRIRDCVGTENVRGVNMKKGDGVTRKAGKPVCVVVDEVDGVVSGSSGGGEGGFMKALIDLIQLDQKNSGLKASDALSTGKKRKKGDNFRLLRPMILICNDVYHAALRPLRASNLAEIIHLRKPPLDKVIARMQAIFDRENIPNEKDGIRRLCEATWGLASRKEGRSTASSSSAEGDVRSVLVVGEWAASRLRATASSNSKLTRPWVEKHLLVDLRSGGSASRGLGRGDAKEAAERVFLEGAGFPKTPASIVDPKPGELVPTTTSLSDVAKHQTLNLLREVVDTCGDTDRIMTDIFTAYPSQPFQDDTFLSKPNAASDWLHFHDTLSVKVHSQQEWELAPYLSQSVLAFHHLFASPAKAMWANQEETKTWGAEQEEPAPFTGPRADFAAFEAIKQSKATLQALQNNLSIPLQRSFRSVEEMSTDFVPYLVRMLNPDVKPVVVGGSGDIKGTASVRRESEKDMVRRAVEAMGAAGITFEKSRVEDVRGGYGGFVLRMEP